MAGKIKLVATDMDGTFLDEEGSFDRQRLATLLAAFRDKDMIFTIASGRSGLALEALFDGFSDQLAIIAENGALVQYQGRVLSETLMGQDQYLEIIDQIFASPYNQGPEILLSGKRASYVRKDSPQDYIRFMEHYYRNIELVDDFAQVDDHIYKLTTNFPPEDLDRAMAWLNDQLDYIQVVTTGFQSVDVILNEANKGLGLNQLCQDLGLVANQVMAFGDNLNDLEMLEFAGSSIAPNNARQEIQDLADVIIGHHADGSVISYMEGMLAYD